MGVTRDDVARRAGVSTAVVSYVVNNGPRRVSDDARSRVLAAISELGYRRDGVARMLATGRSSSIGLVVPNIEVPYFSRVTQALSTLATQQGYQLVVGSSAWNAEQETAQLRAMAERRVEGIILMSVDPLQPFDSLAALGIPIAIVDRPSFAVDGTALVTSHLIEHGRKRIGVILGPDRLPASSRRKDGWARALREHDLEPDPDLCVRIDPDLQGGYEGARSLIETHPDVDAIVIESDLQALGALRALHEAGRRVPEDIALATADATDFAPFSVPSLTTLVQPTTDIVSAAVDAVLNRADSPSVQLIDIKGFALAVGESCGCA